MLVTFHCKSSPSITYVDDVALKLLKIMGHSGTVPSALPAVAIPAAFSRLQQALAASAPEVLEQRHDQGHGEDTEDTEAALPVALRLRAYPMIQMLYSAGLKGNDITWENGTPPV